MIYLPLAAGVPFIMKLVGIVWVFSAFCLIFIILIQKGKGGGLSGAFGGLGAGGLLGTKTGDFLTWVTIGLVVAFLGLGVIMVKYYKPAKPTFTEPETALPVEAAESTGTPAEAPAEGAGSAAPAPAPAEETPGTPTAGAPTDAGSAAPAEGAATDPAGQ